MRRLAIAALVMAMFVTSGVFAQQKSGKDSVYEELNFFDEAFERVRQDAVDPVTDTKLIGSAIAGMLSGLDPHSSFLDEAAFRRAAGANDNRASLGVWGDRERTVEGISPQDGRRRRRPGSNPEI
jgi:carboxyl-terminal processing protease